MTFTRKESQKNHLEKKSSPSRNWRIGNLVCFSTV